MAPFAEYPEYDVSCSSLSSLMDAKSPSKPLHYGGTTSNKKSVRFSDFDEVREIVHIKDMTADEIASLWDSDEERAAIRVRAQTAVAMMNNNVCDGVECFRGLEQHTKVNNNKSKEALSQLYDIVYEIQNFEDLHGVRVPEELLSKYLKAVSLPSKEEARARALQDVVDAASM
jgi:hypothetical protein